MFNETPSTDPNLLEEDKRMGMIPSASV